MLYSRVILLAIVLLSFISNSTAEVTKFSLMGWVGLWNEEMVEWAENENRIYKLCPKSMSSDSYEKCRRNNLAKKTEQLEQILQVSSHTLRSLKKSAHTTEVVTTDFLKNSRRSKRFDILLSLRSLPYLCGFR